MATCFDVAEYFLANKDVDDEITMLKLQKLCAYAQAFTLALLGHPLFKFLKARSWPARTAL